MVLSTTCSEVVFHNSASFTCIFDVLKNESIFTSIVSTKLHELQHTFMVLIKPWSLLAFFPSTINCIDSLEVVGFLFMYE